MGKCSSIVLILPVSFIRFNMNIKFIISKNYNHFFFVQTLADWHFSCRSEYVEEWLKETGPLTENENKALTAFRSVLKKYGFDSLNNCLADNAFDFFMRFEELEEKGPFSENEIEIYLNAMRSLENRFNKIWKRESEKLAKIENLLNNKFNKNKSEVSNDLKILFKDQIDTETEIKVILLLSTEESGSGAGGANNGPNIVSLECSSVNFKDINYLLSTLWHEITHLTLDDYIGKVASIMKSNDIIKEASFEAEKINFDYSRELLSFSIFSPMSFLTEKYFPTEVAEKLSDSVLQKDEEWLLEAKYVFIMYLIYLNGQFFKKKLSTSQSISPLEMANAIITNHIVVKDFFSKYNKKPEWFGYS